MLAYHITACVTIIDMAIPLTRANRITVMRESDERITDTLPARLPAFNYALVISIVEGVVEIFFLWRGWREIYSHSHFYLGSNYRHSLCHNFLA